MVDFRSHYAGLTAHARELSARRKQGRSREEDWALAVPDQPATVPENRIRADEKDRRSARLDSAGAARSSGRTFFLFLRRPAYVVDAPCGTFLGRAMD